MSANGQRVLLWWSVAFAVVFAVSMIVMMRMIPPPTATWSAERIAQFYTDNQTQIKLGAMLASWGSAFTVPLTVVIAVQMYRHEVARPLWTIVAILGGSLMSIFTVLPPLFFGVAAYTPSRAPEVTAIMHELGVLSLITTDQYYIFLFVALAVISLLPHRVVNSPFPRWFGYLTAWLALMFETGAIAFLPRTGPFAWNGLMTFWLPFAMFGCWLILLSVLLFRAISAQQAGDSAAEQAGPATCARVDSAV